MRCGFILNHSECNIVDFIPYQDRTVKLPFIKTFCKSTINSALCGNVLVPSACLFTVTITCSDPSGLLLPIISILFPLSPDWLVLVRSTVVCSSLVSTNLSTPSPLVCGDFPCDPGKYIHKLVGVTLKSYYPAIHRI